MIKKYLAEFLAGFIPALLFFFGPGLITGNGGILGIELLTTFFPNSVLGLLLIGIVYALLLGSLVLMLKKLFVETSENFVKTFGFIVLGVYAAYLLAVQALLIAVSNFGF